MTSSNENSEETAIGSVEQEKWKRFLGRPIVASRSKQRSKSHDNVSRIARSSSVSFAPSLPPSKAHGRRRSAWRFKPSRLSDIPDAPEEPWDLIEEQTDATRIPSEPNGPLPNRRSSEDAVVSELRAQLRQTEARLAEAEERIQRADAEKREMEGKVAVLARRLKETQEQHASLRSATQKSETKEPGEMIDSFRDLKRAIQLLCRRFGATISDFEAETSRAIPLAPPPAQTPQTSPSDSLTSKNAAHFASLKKLLTTIGGPSLCNSSRGEGRPLEDFLDFTLRLSISSTLVQDLFDRFHPELSHRGTSFLLTHYESIRRREPQVVAGRWRAASFAAIEQDGDASVKDAMWAKEFVSHVTESTIAPLVRAIHDTWDTSMLPKSFWDALFEIGRTAYLWNRDVKCECVSLDFRVVMSADGERYDDTYMALYDKHNARFDGKGRRILAAVGMGLKTSAVTGNDEPAQEVWHEKVDVLTEGYFT